MSFPETTQKYSTVAENQVFFLKQQTHPDFPFCFFLEAFLVNVTTNSIHGVKPEVQSRKAPQGGSKAPQLNYDVQQLLNQAV